MPLNHKSKDDRLADWNAATNAAARFRPRPVPASASARYDWLAMTYDSDLPATSRHIALVLALCGNPDGSRIFPGVRELARRTGLSQRSVSTHLDLLVRRGFLGRKPRNSNAASVVGSGFCYTLTVPEVLKDIQHGAEGRSANKGGAEVRSARRETSLSTSAEPDSKGAERGAAQAPNDVQQTSSGTSSNTSGRRRAPNGAAPAEAVA